jgi:uncharacterized membrane protein YgdD (TMEM256/DUF423 family)
VNFQVIAALLGLTSVVAGAFGAHGLRGRLSPEMLQAFETGARYQMFHALALFVPAGAATPRPRAATWSCWLFVAGTVLFSGSLYAIALTGLPIWGVVTPLGGLSLMGGWLALAFSLASARSR